MIGDGGVDDGLSGVVLGDEGNLKGVGCEVIVDESVCGEVVCLWGKFGVGEGGLGEFEIGRRVVFGGGREWDVGEEVDIGRILRMGKFGGDVVEVRFLREAECVEGEVDAQDENGEEFCRVDVVICVPVSLPLSELPARFLSAAQRHYIAYSSDQLRPYHFAPETFPICITLMFNPDDDDASQEMINKRQSVHSALLLPKYPTFRKSMSLKPATPSTKPPLLTNVHKNIRPHDLSNASEHTIRGTYAYHHYGQDNINDNGWGCAYRSLQTLISWSNYQGYTTTSKIPSHKEIQEILVKLGDKPTRFIGSREWIGANEVCYVLEEVTGIQSKIVHVSSGSEMMGKGRMLKRHFEKYGSPVMVGGGVLAYTIVGVAFDEDLGTCRFLILDPHYCGEEREEVVRKKGWVGWKGAGIFKKNCFYNLCLPIPSAVV